MVSILVVAGVGLLGLHRMRAETDRLTGHTIAALGATADLAARVATAHDTAMQQLATSDPAVAGRIGLEIDSRAIPRLREAVRTVRLLTSDDTGSGEELDRIQGDLDRYQRLRGAVDRRQSDGSTPDQATRTALIGQIDPIFDRMSASAESVRRIEEAGAEAAGRNAAATFLSTRRRLLLGAAGTLLGGLLALLLLLRRGEAADRHGADRTDFTETLQVTATEEEAHDLVRRYLDRSLPQAAALVLTRNNSENRLEAATGLPPGSPLADRLVGAEPRECLSLRFGRTHVENPGRPPLLSCGLCADPLRRSTCEPLLVGGQVIGSVLVAHRPPLDREQRALIRGSVAQAAPVLANLRNLALAEFRANNDSLTGLPNKRATDDTLKRMVAQAKRAVRPLAAAMLDLDHFKQVNDRFGHGKGDEVLAAVGAAVRSCLREGDFAGRYGGEELLVLLPDTTAEGALVTAERIRTTVEAVTVPGVTREITVSIGIADLIQHGGDVVGLLRQADRALYAAKAAGRNRTVVAPVGEALPGPARPADPADVPAAVWDAGASGDADRVEAAGAGVGSPPVRV